MKRPSSLTVILVVAVVLFVAWIARNTEWGEVTVPTPLRGDAATNPFYAAQQLVETLGATSERRESLGATSTDAVVVLSTWGWDINNARRAELERWVEAGGRLVVDAALITGSDAFERWSGIEREREEPEDAADRDLFEAPEIIEPCQDARGDQLRAGRLSRGVGVLRGLQFRLRRAGSSTSDRVLWALERRGTSQAARVRRR